MRMPTPARGAKTKSLNIGKSTMQTVAAAAAATAALERTPPKGHPSSKYYERRVVEARHWEQEARIVSELNVKARGPE